MAEAVASTPGLRRWQIATLGLMVAGYSGYYLCRSNLSVTLSLITDELTAQGIEPATARLRLGWVVTLGTIAYALGKFASGGLVDLLGGRRNYLIGMAGAIASTILFTLGSSVGWFTLAWFANRLIQSLGWPGMIKITSRWFSYSRYGTVAGIISLSFLFGDAVDRWFMGKLISAGLSWRAVFWVAAGVLGGLWALSVIFVRESPADWNLPETESQPNPANLFGAQGGDPHATAFWPILATLVRSSAFWVVCFLSLGLTLLRETFNTWTPTYLVEGAGLGPGAAAGTSALFPLFGGVSVLLAGALGDRFGRGGRAIIILTGVTLAGLALVLLGLIDFHSHPELAKVSIAAVGFLLIGPYSYLAGAISLDLGGKRGCATASGLIDGIGYIGGALAGVVIAKISVDLGWQGVFLVLAGVALVTSLAAARLVVSGEW
jgi:OPA family glycerol-3-phosphate transporter-like MFS transporter